MVEENRVAAVSKKYREDQGLSQESFTAMLLEKLANWTLTRQAVSLWEKGKTEPDIRFLFWVMLVYSDWRMEYAIDMICAVMPEAFYRDKYGLAVKNGREKVIA